MIEQAALVEIRRLAEPLTESAPAARVIHGRREPEATDFASVGLAGLEAFIHDHEVRRVITLEAPFGPGYLFDAFGITADLIFGWRLEIVRDGGRQTLLERGPVKPSSDARRLRRLIVETRPRS